MRLSAIICVMLLSGCAETVRTIYAAPSVPADLRQPVAAPCGPVVVERDVALCLIAKARGLDQANARIVAVDEILTLAEAEAK